jgi:hypothetical protein
VDVREHQALPAAQRLDGRARAPGRRWVAEQLGAQPGFVSYEFLDGGDGDVLTISVLYDAGGARRSGELAQR